MSFRALLVGDPTSMFQKVGEGLLMDAVNEILPDLRDDWESTVSTWVNAPVFDVEHAAMVGSDIVGTVSSDNPVLGYVNNGTVPHLIFPVKAKALRFFSSYQAKTSPGVIGSSAGGSSGDPVFSQGVHHPGSQGRAFDQAIADKRQADFESIIGRLIGQAAKG